MGLKWEEADRVANQQWRKRTAAGLRNSALIAVASDALLRVSEIQAILIRDLDLEVNSLGNSILTIPRSKTDPEGEGVHRVLGSKTTLYLKSWLDYSMIDEGHVVQRLSRSGRVMCTCLSPGSIRAIAKRSIEEAGLKGRYSGHSMRIGSAQSLLEHGATLAELMQEGRWKSPRMAIHYVSAQLALCSATARLRYGA